MNRGTPLVLAIVCVAHAAACTETGPPAAGVTQRDSAGVSIIEHTAGTWAAGPVWTVPAQPTLQIGEESGSPEYLFSGVVGAVRLPDGRIAVANRSTGEIRIYDAAGRFVAAMGGRGDGPGEFQRLAWLGLSAGDSLLALDDASRRLSLFGADGTFHRSIQVGGQGTGVPQVAGVFENGSVIVGERASALSARTGLSAPPLAFVRYDRAGSPVDTLATVPGPEQLTRVSQGGMSVTTPPFGRFPVGAARGARAFLSANDRFEIGVFGRDGRLRALIRRQGGPEPITTEQLEEVIAAVHDDNARRAYRDAIAEMPRNRTMPVFSEFVADATGSVWLREFGRREETATWHVVSPDGAPPVSIRLPGPFRPTDIGAEYLLGVWTDELGVEHVRLYPLRRQPGD